MFKKITHLFLILVLLFSSSFSLNVFAATTKLSEQSELLDISKYNKEKLEQSVTLRQLFYVYFSIVWEGIPESYKYIKLEFQNITPWSELYKALQKGVYLDLVNNRATNLDLDRTASEDSFAKMIRSNFGTEIAYTQGSPLKLRTILEVLNNINEESQRQEEEANGDKYTITNVSNFPVLDDAFVRIKNWHYDGEKFKDEVLIQGAISGMADATKDKHTVYFPPVAAKSFHDELGWEFEGIGANIDMLKPGQLRVISPLPGSPAEKIGVKSGDLIKKIDDTIVTEDMSLSDAVSIIKWPANSTVKLTIDRNGIEVILVITRAKIIIKYVEDKKLENNDYYIKINTFGAGTSRDFHEAVKRMAKENYVRKVIIDLRNNPGGSLDEVTNILNLFVPADQSVVHIKLRNYATDINSIWENLYAFDRARIIILQNEWSASASEIMAGTIKDYLPSTTIIGTKSYGKWSVQSIEDYTDGSTLKYTIAKWFTGKNQIWIDGTGIKPDIEVKVDEAQKTNGIDNQLEYAKNMQ